jgi:hypothetical protein
VVFSAFLFFPQHDFFDSFSGRRADDFLVFENFENLPGRPFFQNFEIDLGIKPALFVSLIRIRLRHPPTHQKHPIRLQDSQQMFKGRRMVFFRQMHEHRFAQNLVERRVRKAFQVRQSFLPKIEPRKSPAGFLEQAQGGVKTHGWITVPVEPSRVPTASGADIRGHKALFKVGPDTPVDFRRRGLGNPSIRVFLGLLIVNFYRFSIQGLFFSSG